MTKRAKLVQMVPVLPSRDIRRSLDYYVNKLGFIHAFIDPSNDKLDPKYVGVIRDEAELQIQWHGAQEWEGMTTPLTRVIVDDVDALFREFEPRSVFGPHTKLRNTEWLTREFGFFDPDGNGLIFFRDLSKDEIAHVD